MYEVPFNGALRYPIQIVDSTGAALAPDSTPTFEIFDEGNATPIRTALSATLVTARTGCYWLTENITAANSASYGHGRVYTMRLSATLGGIVNVTTIPFRICPYVLRYLIATGGSTTTVTLDAAASAVDDEYKGATLVKLSYATGRYEFRSITGYVGSTKVATVQRAFNSAAANGDIIHLLAHDNGMADGVALSDNAGANMETFFDNGGSATTAIVDSVGSASPATIATAILDAANGIEAGMTPRQALRLMTAVLAGKSSGLPGSSVIFRNAVADSKTRVTASVDVNANRTAITSDLT